MLMIDDNTFYNELCDCSKKLHDLMRKDDSVVSKLVNSAMTFIWLWEFARNEGLLSLEEAAESDRIKDQVLGNELPGIMMLIVDGTDPEIVEEICLRKYYTSDYSILERFLFLVYMNLLICIQTGESSYILKERLFAMMPDKVNDEIERLLEKEDENPLQIKIKL